MILSSTKAGEMRLYEAGGTKAGGCADGDELRLTWFLESALCGFR